MLDKVQDAGLSYFRNEDWRCLRHGIFTRHGGVSEAPWNTLNVGASIGDPLDAVKENHARIYRVLDLCGERAASCWLVHGVDVLVAGEDTRNGEPLQKADALICDQPDRPLVMRYADCVPLLFYDKVRRAIGLGHAGWRGTAHGIASRIVQMMTGAFGCRAEDIEVVAGPAISRRNYQVGEEVAACALAYYGEGANVIWRDPVRRAPHFDLWRANRLDLERSGVTDIKILDICTFENTVDFYSHRAEKGETGRFAVVMSL